MGLLACLASFCALSAALFSQFLTCAFFQSLEVGFQGSVLGCEGPVGGAESGVVFGLEVFGGFALGEGGSFGGFGWGGDDGVGWVAVWGCGFELC